MGNCYDVFSTKDTFRPVNDIGASVNGIKRGEVVWG